MKILSFIILFLFILSTGASEYSITVVNDCDFTVWPGIKGIPDLSISGFELPKGNSRSLKAPGYWRGILWGRTGCSFNRSGHWSCKTGDCGSDELACNGRSPTPPVTLATFGLEWGRTYYGVNLTSGYNLQMTMEATGDGSDLLDCAMVGCADDLNQRCPSELKLEGGGGCKSACQVYGSPEYCCGIRHNADESCKPTVYTELFMSACPRSYMYNFKNFDAISECNGANYTIRFCPSANAFSMIKFDRQLNFLDQLVSVSGNFTLGFFDYGPYLGIWYTNEAESRRVWVANPNKPITTYSGKLALSIDPNTGNLIIIDGDVTLMNITSIDIGPNPNVTATLEDNGNFRLINETNKRVLWQSFDHPTNILLPGMKLGSDITTGRNWTLTSWLSNEILHSGAFTLSWEPNYTLMIRRRGQPYWISGNLRRQKFPFLFALNSPHSRSQYILTSVYNDEEMYFSYTVDGNAALPMWILTPKGQLTDVDESTAWTPEFCYGYDSGDGCVKESSLPPCRTKNDKFNKLNGEFAPEMTRNDSDENPSLSIGDCFAKCWNDCNCVGFNSKNKNGTGCVIWMGNNSFLVNLSQNSTWKYVLNTHNLISPSTSTVNRKAKSMKLIWIAMGVAIPLVFICLGLLRYTKKRKQRREADKKRNIDEKFLELTASESFIDEHQLESNGGNGHDILLFSFASIMAATCEFSDQNKLGQGGFGPVYMGILSDGREIAVKRLSRVSGQGLVEFKNELILIAKLQHTNLVRVLGCCIHGEEKMLIYEYMPNKSLDYFLFDSNKKSELDWPKRFNIIEGIAQGLLYLHKYSRMRVIHRDLKANNILLDVSMNPKISDFGMARIFNPNETQAMTNRVVGTYGYMAPEYAMEGTFSIKSDIYSFGVLILEIVSGRRNSSFNHLGRTFNLLGYAWDLWQQGNALDLEDPSVGSTSDIQQVLRTVHVALLCVQEDAMDRPTTSDMISMLLNDTISLPTPNKPAFVLGRAELRSTSNEIYPSDCSVNNMTITVAEGR